MAQNEDVEAWNFGNHLMKHNSIVKVVGFNPIAYDTNLD